MDETKILKGKIIDTANRAYNQNIYTYTSFLGISELDVYYNMLPEISFIDSNVFGGRADSERQIIQFGSESLFGYEGHYPISVIKVSPLITKFSDDLNHRDFLGAILNLGIERSLIGDIVIKNNTGYVFCLEHIAEFIMENLTKIKHTNVKCELTEVNLENLQPSFQEIDLIAASERIDAVVAGITKLSRSQSVLLFRSKKIFINGKQMENNSYVLKPGDILVIRGNGKFIFESSGGETRKGRTYVHLKKYV